MKGRMLALAIAGAVVISSIFHTDGYSDGPTREMRGAWIATVHGLDWPKSRNSTEQQAELKRLLSSLKSAGINAVFFQVRAEGDAFYASETEPWSRWLTGEPGKAPAPYYDPLQLVIEEAHRLGMEVHAWLNPYRVASRPNSSMHSTHISRKQPGWVLRVGDATILDPGLPEVRDYVTAVVMEIARKYAVDGIHFDDYFYPYPPHTIGNHDNRTFAAHGAGFSDRAEWRRNNVNLLIKQISDSLSAHDPSVHFGISPFGIWKPGVPEGISGLSAYDQLYADALHWLDSETVDYVVPQLYWRIGGRQDYGALLGWWADNANGRHVYAGQALHNLEGQANWAASEILEQIRLNRDRGAGAVFFRTAHLVGNTKGIGGHFRQGVFGRPALPPAMLWKDSQPPNPPQNVSVSVNQSGRVELRWDDPIAPPGQPVPVRFAVYRIDPARVVDVTTLDDRSATLIGITGGNSFNDEEPVEGHLYLVTSVNRSRVESSPAVPGIGGSR